MLAPNEMKLWKKSKQTDTITAAHIGGRYVLIAAIIGGVFAVLASPNYLLILVLLKNPMVWALIWTLFNLRTVSGRCE